MQTRQLIECVPNFSEGRDPAIIKQITDAIESVEGVSLLDVDPGRATNRTVVTFVGEPGPVVQAPSVAWAFLVPGLIIHTTFGVLSGLVSSPLIRALALENNAEVPVVTGVVASRAAEVMPKEEP